MKKPTLRQNLRYRFDNLMSKGTPSLLLILAVITLITVLIGGTVAILLGGADGSGEGTGGYTFWFTLMHAINTGVLAKEEGTVAYLSVMTVVTLVGIFITSFLIGTISNAIKEKVTELQRGKSDVIEEGHTVIIGFNENVTGILEELVYANENQKDAVAVILADHDKTDMEDTIRDRLGSTGNLRVVCRNGRPDSLKDLKVCSLDTCKSIIVNLDDDFMSVKTILACEELLNEAGNEEAYITATVRDWEVLQPAKIAGGEKVEILNFHKTMAKLMVQAGRHPGMSEILLELLSFKGNEIYVIDGLAAAGLSLAQINMRLPRSTAVGIVRDEIPVLNPGADMIVEKGDQLIVIAEDDEGIRLQNEAVVNEEAYEYEADQKDRPQTLLVLGASDLLRQILIEENACAVKGSKVILAAEEGKIDKEQLPESGQLANISLEIRECKIYARRVLEKLACEKPDSILLLADTDLSDEEADARTLMLQLLLTDISKEIGAEIPLTIQMNSIHNQKLSQMMRGTDFVVSSRITARMMAHIAEQRHSKAILNDLLSDGKSGIYMKPITRYVHTEKPVDFYTLGSSAARYGEIAIGYKKFADDGSFSIEINPRSRLAAKFSEKDDVIVIAENPLESF